MKIVELDRRLSTSDCSVLDNFARPVTRRSIQMSWQNFEDPVLPSASRMNNILFQVTRCRMDSFVTEIRVSCLPRPSVLIGP